jgi:bifunctional non-homologous end joining protein LigD
MDRRGRAEAADQAIRPRRRGGGNLHDPSLAGDGDDYRRLPLSMRKTNLARLLDRRPEGIHAAPCEVGKIGPALFPHACKMGLEGLVSKHAGRAYSAGRCNHWVKVKNPDHAAFSRMKDQHSRAARNRLRQ